jgi:hypothetical protein
MSSPRFVCPPPINLVFLGIGQFQVPNFLKNSSRSAP